MLPIAKPQKPVLLGNSMSMSKPQKQQNNYMVDESKEDVYMGAMDPDRMSDYLESQREQNEYNKCIMC
jgi:hypothetical protein